MLVRVQHVEAVLAEEGGAAGRERVVVRHPARLRVLADVAAPQTVHTLRQGKRVAADPGGGRRWAGAGGEERGVGKGGGKASERVGTDREEG